ncbi:ATP-binding protein [Lactobacillus sp. R2/2]|nr:ATP-binding protein [Lactobacillus sp. R2/2]
MQVLQENHGDYLLTAHHVDDLLENILLKFIRSGNPGEMNSLHAISSVNGFTLLRPLLTQKKADLLLYDQKREYSISLMKQIMMMTRYVTGCDITWFRY